MAEMGGQMLFLGVCNLFMIRGLQILPTQSQFPRKIFGNTASKTLLEQAETGLSLL
jgi:hypothetical protein